MSLRKVVLLFLRVLVERVLNLEVRWRWVLVMVFSFFLEVVCLVVSLEVSWVLRVESFVRLVWVLVNLVVMCVVLFLCV